MTNYLNETSLHGEFFHEIDTNFMPNPKPTKSFNGQINIAYQIDLFIDFYRNTRKRH